MMNILKPIIGNFNC